MKKLIVSLKTSAAVLKDFKTALKSSSKKQKKISPHIEISFDNKKDFQKFIQNMDLLSLIIHYKPASVYELAKICNKDVSNLNKTINFFEEIGVIKIKRSKISGREVNRPVVEYDTIQFLLAA